MSGRATSDVADRDDLIERLVALGDVLDVDHDVEEASVVEAVLEGIRAPGRSPRRGWLVAAAAALVAAIVLGGALQPDARDAVARWFGLDGVDVEVDPDLTAPPSPPPSVALPGPGESDVVTVDGRRVLFSAIDGRLTDALITKTVQGTDQIREVEVAGHPGLWISGGSHEVLYETPGSGIVVARFAADTLLWQEGAVLYRVEGFDDLAEALAFAEGT
jgi:hypothetical protein